MIGDEGGIRRNERAAMNPRDAAQLHASRALCRRLRAAPVIALAIAWLGLHFSPAAASSGGIAGYAGARGALYTCALCHYGGSLSGSAHLLIQAEADPGETVPIDVYYTGAVPHAWGFNLIAIDDATGLSVGQLTAKTGSQVLTYSSLGWDYLSHAPGGITNRIGATSNPGWEVQWTAPASAVDDVTFYLALNATDHNGSSSGDTVYTTTASLTVPEPRLGLGMASLSLALLGLARLRVPAARGLETSSIGSPSRQSRSPVVDPAYRR